MTTVPDLRTIPPLSLAQSELPEKSAKLPLSTRSGEPVGVSLSALTLMDTIISRNALASGSIVVR